MMHSVTRKSTMRRAVPALAAVLYAAASAAAAEAAVSSACEVDYPPFSIVHEDGRADGFAVELMRAALAAMNREVTFRTGTWDEVRGWLENGQVQALPLAGRTPEREPLFDFTFAYMNLHGAIVVREDVTDIHDLEDLRGRQVAVMQGDNAEEFLRREDRGIEIHATPTFDAALSELAAGRYDAVVIQRLVALRLIEEAGLTSLKILDTPVEGFQQDFCFAVKEGDRDTLALLNEGLSIVMADGTYRHLHAKWFAALELPTDRTIVVAGDHDGPPYEFLDNRGHPVGYNVELARAIAAEMGLDIEVRLGPKAEIMQALEMGEVDIIPGLYYSPDRALRFGFTQPHSVHHYVAITRKEESGPPSTISELTGLDIVVRRGSAIYDFLKDHGLGDSVSFADTVEDALRELAAGQHDCALLPRISALYLIEKNGWASLNLGEKSLAELDYCFAALKNRKALLTEFSEGLKVLEQNGEYRRIYNKWLGVYKEEPFPFYTALFYSGLILGPAACILLAVLFWVWTLRRLVKAKTKELSESLDRFQYVFDAANVGKSITLPTGELNANKALADWLGYTQEELQHKTWQELVPPGEVPEIERQLAPLFDGREDSTRFEKSYLRRDGTCVWADISARIRRDENGNPLYLATTVVDITERKQAETELRQREQFLNEMARIAKIGGWEMDPATRKARWTQGIYDIVEIEPGQPIPGLDEHIAYYLPAYRAMIREAMRALIEDDAPLDFEAEMRTATGNVKWCRAVGRAERRGGACVRVYGAFQDITGRKQAEEALAGQKRRLGYILQGTNVGTWEWNVQTGECIFNERWAGIIGYTLDEISPVSIDTWMEFCHPGDLEKSGRLLQACFDRESEYYHCECRMRHKNGAWIWVLDRGKVATWTEDGKPEWMYGTHQEITPRKQAEEALRKERNFAESLLDTAQTIVLVLDTEGRVVRFNPYFEELSGYRLEEMKGRDWISTFLPENERHAVRELFLKAIGDVQTKGNITQILTKNGELRDIEWYDKTLKDANGSITGLMATGQDITERRHSERALRESERNLKAILNAVTESLFLADVEGNVLVANAEGCRRLGIDPENATAEDVFRRFPPDIAQSRREQAQKVYESGQAVHFEDERLGRHYATTIYPCYDEDDSFSGVAVFSSDITERKRLEEQLRQAQKMEAIGQLAGGVAHDFNNILQALMGYNTLLLNDLPEADETHGFVEEMAKGVERAAGLTRQLLMFSRRQIMQPKDLDLNEIVENLLKMLRRIIGEDIQLEWVPGKPLGTIHADTGMMEQILMNLCINARDAMPEGGTVTIETQQTLIDSAYCAVHVWASPGRYVLLSVTDTGCGMDAETLERIFEPFFTTKGVGKGTGLGLATVYGIVRQHEGMVNVYSEPGQGTTFKVYLPLSERPAKAVGTLVQGKAGGGHETILLAEDDEKVRKLARRILEGAGYTVLAANDGEEAVALFEAHRAEIALLFLDVVMPNLGGKQAMERILEIRPGIPVLFSSGYSENAVHTDFVLHAGLKLISKPYAPELLLRTVREMLDRKKNETEPGT